jgi:hypothetical protein
MNQQKKEKSIKQHESAEKRNIRIGKEWVHCH